jgi:hypothetical protein
MANKRHSTQDIAEILIDKFKDMERTAKTIEKASNKTLRIDTTELKQIMAEHRSERNQILSDIRKLREKNRARLPNWVFAVLAGLFLAFLGATVYMVDKAEKYDMEKGRAEYYERLYRELKEGESTK